MIKSHQEKIPWIYKLTLLAKKAHSLSIKGLAISTPAGRWETSKWMIKVGIRCPEWASVIGES